MASFVPRLLYTLPVASDGSRYALDRVIVTDVSGDGLPDIAAIEYDASDNLTRLAVSINDGAGGFLAPVGYSLPDLPALAGMADVTGDGIPDFVGYSRLDNALIVMAGLAGGGFAPPVVTHPGSGLGDDPARSISLADMNGDGRPDIVIGGSSAIWILPGEGGGAFGAPVAYSASGPGYSLGYFNGLAIADMNGDGRPDVVTAGTGDPFVAVWLNDGHGGLATPTTYPVAAGTNGAVAVGDLNGAVAVGDLNGDGRPDVVVGDQGSNAEVLLNDGHGGLAAARVVPIDVGGGYHVGYEPATLSLADVNGDGSPDLVAQAAFSAGSDFGDNLGAVVWTNDGKGHFAYSTSETDLQPLAVADLNGDGVADLIGGDTSLKVDYGVPAGRDLAGPRHGHGTVNGSLGNDTIRIWSEDNVVYGNGGNDTIDGGGDRGLIYVGAGSDSVSLHGYDDTVTGYAPGDASSVFGADGATTVDGGRGRAVIDLGDGDDHVSVGGWHNQVTLGGGNDFADIGLGVDSFTGGGNSFDTVVAHGHQNVITLRNPVQAGYREFANPNDTITGGEGEDTISVNYGAVDLDLRGWNDQVSLGETFAITASVYAQTVATVTGGMGTDLTVAYTNVTLAGGHQQTVTVRNQASIDDLSRGLTVALGPPPAAETIDTGPPVVTILDASKDSRFVLELTGGTGGFSRASQAVAALTSDGNGGTRLAVPGLAGMTVDFVDTPQSFLTASRFRIG